MASEDSQAYFWTPKWQAKERRADADLKAGRFREFKTAAELIAYLNAVEDSDAR